MKVMLCCNHPRNGTFRGTLPAVEFPNLNLVSPYCDSSLRVRVADNRLTLGNNRRSYQILAYGEWVGNWCWDLAVLRHVDAVDMLNFLLAFGYRPESGNEEYWEKIESGGLFRVSDFIQTEDHSCDAENVTVKARLKPRLS